MIYEKKLRNYILNTCYAYIEDEIDEYEIKQLKHDLNWFSTNDGSKNFNDKDPENVLIVIDKNYFSLCSLMEEKGAINPRDYTVIQFYSKLDYINSQAKNNEDVGR